MRFEEELLTNGKTNQNHINNVSFGNCMLRIPGSLNSNQVRFNEKDEIVDMPPEAEVRIIHHWDGYRPSVKPLLPQYYIWLQAADARDIDRQIEAIKHDRANRRVGKSAKNTIDWIEKLFDTPLDDFRNYCIWRIIVPYLVNIKGLSRLESRDTVKTWLDKCNSVSRLKFNTTSKIDDELNRVGTYWPAFWQAKI